MKTYIQKIDGKWYAYAADEKSYQVRSIGRDNPDPTTGGRAFVARWTAAGVQYVSSPSPSRRAAYDRARRHGKYGGEIK